MDRAVIEQGWKGVWVGDRAGNRLVIGTENLARGGNRAPAEGG